MSIIETIKSGLSLANLLYGSKVPSELIDRVFNILEAAAEEGLELLENEFRYLTMHIQRTKARGNSVTEFIEGWLELRE